MKYRAALIGCGKIGSEFDETSSTREIYTHAGAYTACASTQLMGVCDADPLRVKNCGEYWHVTEHYTDPLELLTNIRPDIVSLCTPDFTHADLLRVILQFPGVKAVLAEKPLALTVAEARELVMVANAHDIVLAVNYSRRYASSHTALKHWLAQGGLGAVQTVNGYYVKGLLHNGTHWLDLARYLIGDIETVRGYDRLYEPGADPTLDAELDFADGARGYLCGLNTHAFTLFEMDIMGTTGRVRLTEAGHTFEVYAVANSTRYANYRELTCIESELRGGLDKVMLHAVEDVVRCLTDGTPVRCAGREGVAALELAFAIRASAREGVPQRMAQP